MTDIPGSAENNDSQVIPASVRNAPDLSQMVGGDRQQPGSIPGAESEPSWRFEVESPQDFEKYVQLSSRGAVIFALYAEHSPTSLETVEHLQKLVDSAQGNLLLATVDITKYPEIGQAFQIQGVPAAIAVIAAQPVPMFNSQVSPKQMTDLLQQVLQIAAQQQLPGGFEPAASTEKEKPLPPLHQEALDALDRGDFAAATAAYTKALSENPGDHDAKVGLAQVGLLSRVRELDANTVRATAASNPQDIAAALQVADLDVSGGHVEDAFDRLIKLFLAVDAEHKNEVRERLLELFEVVGAQDPRVIKARAALMMAIF